MAHHNYTLRNTRGEITHLACHAGECPSVIDLSFTNPEATEWDTFKDWAIDPDLALDSNHNTIKFTIDHGLKEIENIFATKYCINKVDPTEWSKAFEQELTNVEAKISDLHDIRSPTETQLNDYDNTLSDAIKKAIALSAKERKPSPNAKPWWDLELKQATQHIANAKHAHKSYQAFTGEFSPPLQANILRNRNFFKRLCKFKHG